MPGPTPKRSEERRRRNASNNVDRTAMQGEVVVPELNLEDPHPLVVDLWESLKASGQSQWYEPSDWQRARIACELLSRQLKSGKVSSNMYQTIQSDLASLMTTEGDRRRLRMEIDRDDQSVSEDDPRVALMESYKTA